MSEINFLPVFDQTNPNVWDDFLYIRSAATKYSCGHVMTQQDMDHALQELQSAWKKRGFNFAFGAYDDDNMVGFVQGDCVDRIGTVRSLYVLPEYIGQKIGGKLLRLAEHASSFGATYMDLVSLPRAQKFYEHYDYKPIYWGSNHYTKEITRDMHVRSMTVPVFRATPKITKACKDISQKCKCNFDAACVNKDHKPMFVYVDSFEVIRGYIVGHNYDMASDDEIRITPSQPVNLITTRLDREMRAFRRLIDLSKQKKR